MVKPVDALGCAQISGPGSVRCWIAILVLLLGLGITAPLGQIAWAQSGDSSGTSDGDAGQASPMEGNVPGGHLGTSSDSEIWRAVRQGLQGDVSIPNKQSGVLVQSQGEDWRHARNEFLPKFGAWTVLGAIGFCALFFLLRGRIRVSAGLSGHSIERFNFVDRFAHWLTAGLFVLLALTGLNLLYGKYLLLPILGPEIFSALSVGGKYVHNFLAFSFMVGIVLMLVLWLRHNLPSKWDLIWFAELGGLFSKHSHPPARKFNLGQKVVFWSVILGGLSLSLSGIALLFPFQFTFFGDTFALLNSIGIKAPTEVTGIEEQQLNQLWHAVVSLLLIALIICHIYIGTLGMEGAFDAVGTGMVDENWARDHHSVWVAEVRGEEIPNPDDYTGAQGPQPAE